MCLNVYTIGDYDKWGGAILVWASDFDCRILYIYNKIKKAHLSVFEAINLELNLVVSKKRDLKNDPAVAGS